ncbi:hypothetical protein WAI453_005598 [Rhynchosporium graminicola]
MSSRVIDLTSDASDDEPEAAIPQPIKTSVAAQNGSAISHPIVSAALRKAITIVDPTRLKKHTAVLRNDSRIGRGTAPCDMNQGRSVPHGFKSRESRLE